MGGGGCVGSKVHAQKPDKMSHVNQHMKKIDYKKNKGKNIHEDFESNYKRYINEEKKKKILDDGY